MVCMAPTAVFDLLIISYGQAGESFVSYRHTSVLKKSLLTKQFVNNYQARRHISFLVFVVGK